MTRRQTMYNTHHAKTRIKIEHTFGLLKSRWRILKYVNVNCPIKASRIIATCCMLHNFCYINNDEWKDEGNNEEDDHENIDEEHPMYRFEQENLGVAKRQQIANLFM